MKPSERCRTKLAKLWGQQVLQLQGFTVVPNVLFHAQGEMGITASEFIVLLNLIEYYNLNGNMPFVSIITLARKLGMDKSNVRRHLRQLEKKNLIKTNYRKGNTSLYDLAPLVRALQGIAEKGVQKCLPSPGEIAGSIHAISHANKEQEVNIIENTITNVMADDPFYEFLFEEVT